MIQATAEMQINLDAMDLAKIGAVVFVAVLAALVIAKHI